MSCSQMLTFPLLEDSHPDLPLPRLCLGCMLNPQWRLSVRSGTEYALILVLPVPIAFMRANLPMLRTNILSLMLCSSRSLANPSFRPK